MMSADAGLPLDTLYDLRDEAERRIYDSLMPVLDIVREHYHCPHVYLNHSFSERGNAVLFVTVGPDGEHELVLYIPYPVIAGPRDALNAYVQRSLDATSDL